MYVIGVDAGGTSTRAAVADAAGQVVGYARSGPGNPTSAGLEVAVASIVGSCRQAAQQAGVQPSRVMVTLAGGSGFDVPGRVSVALAETGMPVPVDWAGDVVSAYFSATAEPSGYLVLSGTGATGARIEDWRLTRVCDGVGWLLGDEGSGFWVGREVVRAAAADLDQRGPATALTEMVLAEVADEVPPPPDQSTHVAARADDMWRLMSRVYGRRPVACADFAPLALTAAAAGDPVAGGIVERAGAGLLATCAAIVADDDRPLVLAGGLLHDQSPLSARIRDRYPGRCCRAREGTAGAVLLALRAAGHHPGAQHLERVLDGLS